MTQIVFGDVAAGRRRVVQGASGWARHADAVIQRVIDDCAEKGAPLDETIKAIDAAYPFGERKRWPYKAWLAQRKKAIARLRRWMPWKEVQP